MLNKIRKYREYDEYFTNKIRNITGNNKIKVYKVNIDVPNAANIAATEHLFYFNGLRTVINLNENEITAILLHEYSHFKGIDVHQNTIIYNTFVTIFIRILLKIFGKGLATKVGVPLLQATLIGSALVVTSRTVGRLSEYRADSTAVKFGYGKHLASGLIKLENFMLNKFINKCRKFRLPVLFWSDLKTVFDAHPHTYDRINAVLKKEKNINGVIKRLSKFKETLKKDK
ncbi:MAG: M48 family metallopeptidase [archaeon]